METIPRNANSLLKIFLSIGHSNVDCFDIKYAVFGSDYSERLSLLWGISMLFSSIAYDQ